MAKLVSKGAKVHKKTRQNKISMASYHGVKCLLKTVKNLKINLIRKQVRKLKELKEAPEGTEEGSKKKNKGESLEDKEQKILRYIQAVKVTLLPSTFPDPLSLNHGIGR
jgi:hypothetical protein